MSAGGHRDRTTIAYCFDRTFSKYAAVSTYSLSSSSTAPLNVFWCVPEGDMAVAEELRAKLDLHPRIKLQITPLKSGIFRG